MNLLAPDALWTLAALALPLAVHLWRRPPRTVRLGSLRFLQSRPRRLRTLRWREWALLAARLGLLAALAFLLAHPFQRRAPFSRPQHWVLLDPAAAPAGASRDRLRALQGGRAETRLLAPGFPVIDAPPADGSSAAPDVWSLLREADAALPAGSSLAVLSPGRLASLRGVRPALTHVQVEWIDTPAAPVPAGVPPPAPPPGPLTVRVLHDPNRAEEARYVAAAWRAIAVADQRAVAISTGLTTDANEAAADWIVWLGRRPIPPAVAARAANVLDEADAPFADAPPGWIVSPLPPVRLWQRGPPFDGPAIWTDGFGQPLLTRTHDANGHTRWHFASRFDPAWNDLPLGTALPAALRTLFSESTGTVPDQRLADPLQPPPSDRPPATTAVNVALPGTTVDLRPALWLLAVLLFGVERFLSHRRASRPVPVAIPSPQPVSSR